MGDVAQICYGLPGILLYFLVFWALISLRRQLSSSFLIIYCLLITTNIIAWSNSWLYLKLMNEQPAFYSYYEWMSGQSFLINTMNFLVSHFNYAQNLYLLLLTFDRFAAIVSVTRDLRWWDTYHRYIIFATHLVLLGSHLAIRLPMHISIQVNPFTGFYVIVRADTDNIRNATDANVRLGFGIATFATCLILNIFSLRILMRMKNTAARTIQRTFFAISSCIFATQAMNVAIACLIAVFNTYKMNDALSIAYDGVNYFSDLYSIGPALYTILLPGLIRQFLIRKARKILRMSTDDSTSPPSVTHVVTPSHH